MFMAQTLHTLGYGRWPTPFRLHRTINALKQAGVNLLVDIRISPCSSQLDPKSNYGPRPWNVMAGEAGIADETRKVDIAYLWLVELGNPQKNDREMRVLRAHIEARDECWPVNRGLRQLAELVKVENNSVAIMCACAKYDDCHRKVIAEALRGRYFGADMAIVDST